MKKKELAPFILLLVSSALMAVSIILNSLLIIAGVTGLVVAWFLCIDKLIASAKLSIAYRAILAAIVIGVPIAVTAYLG